MSDDAERSATDDPAADAWRRIPEVPIADRPTGRRWILAAVVGVVVTFVVGAVATVALDSNFGALVGFIAGGLVTGYVVRARTIGRWIGAFVAVFLAGLVVLAVGGAALLASLGLAYDISLD
jgi:hypothetical protein